MADNTNPTKRELEDAGRLLAELNRLKQKGNDLTKDEIKDMERLLDIEDKLIDHQESYLKKLYSGKNILSDVNKTYAEQLEDLSSISSIYGGLVNKQKQTLKTSKDSIASMFEETSIREDQVVLIDEIVSKTNNLQSIQQRIAESDGSNLDTQSALNDLYTAEFESIDKQLRQALELGNLNDEQYNTLLKVLDAQNQNVLMAKQYSNISKEAKDQIESQIEAYDSMKKTIRGTLDTIRMTLQTPQAMIVGASVAAGKFATAMGEVNRETGMFIGSTAALSFVFDDATSTLKQMAKLSGDVNSATFGAQLHTNILAVSLGTSGENAATLVNAFGNLQGSTDDVGRNMISTLGSTARLNGVLPNQIMEDMAGATEEMALYSKGTGENFGMAAIQAAKLGVSIGTTAKIADTLLDFEGSIEKELEASALLGRDINLTKARELAYADDITGATKETLAAVGGINEFNKMDVYQRRAVAEALGVSVGELKQMVANEQNLNTTTGKLEQSFGFINDTLRAVGDKFGGPIASGATFLVGELLRAKLAAAALKGEGLGGMLKSLNPFGGGGGASSVADTIKEKGTDTIQSKVEDAMGKSETPAPTKKGGNALKDLSSGLKSMADSKVLKGAFHLMVAAPAFVLMTAGAIGLAAIATMGVPAGLGLTALGKGLKSFGNAGMAALEGIGLMALFGVALIPLTYALSLLSPLVESIGKGIGTMAEGIGKGIASIVDSISKLSLDSAIGVFALAAAFTSLSAALGMFAIAGLAAIPAMVAVGAFAATGGAELLGNAMGGGNTAGGNGVVDELKALRNDLTSGKIAVYIDGRKVTNSVATTAGKDPTTVRR